jgi:predicted MFS family arabinose efflux permease
VSGPRAGPLAALAAAGFVTMVDMRIADPLLPVLAREFDVGLATAGLIAGGFALPYGVFQLLYGPLADRLGKVRVMAWALLVFAVTHLGFIVAHDFAIVVGLRFLAGASAAAIISLSLAHIGDSIPYEERQAAIGRYMSWVFVGQLLGGAFGGIAEESIGWRDAFLLIGAAAGLCTAALAINADSAPPSGRGRAASYRGYALLLRDRTARLVLVAVFVEGVCCFGPLAYFGAMLRDGFALPYATIGLLLSGYGVGGLLYSRSVRWLLQRLDETRMMRGGVLLVGVALSLIGLIAWWWLFAPAVMLLGFGFYMLHSTLQTKATELAPGARGTAVSLFAFMLFLGSATGTAALGLAIEAVGYAVPLSLAGWTLVLLIWWLAPRLRA